MMQIFILFGIIASPVLLMIVSFFEWTFLGVSFHLRVNQGEKGTLCKPFFPCFSANPDSLPSAIWWQCVGAGRELGASVLQGICTVKV